MLVPLGLPKWFGNSQMRGAAVVELVVVVVMVTQLAIQVMVSVVVEVDK